MDPHIFFPAIDFVLLPFYLGLIYIIANRKKMKLIEANPEYKYYTSGLFARIFAGVIFAIFYFYYYGGGDTNNYFIGGRAMYFLFHKSFDFFSFAMLNGDKGLTVISLFDYSKGSPPFYMMDDPQTFFVIRFITPLVFLSMVSYLTTTVFMSWFAFEGVWRLFLVFHNYFPNYEKELAFSILFFPSVLFWGSGIMKDTITLSAIGWYTYGIYMVFFKKEKIFKHIIALMFAVFLIVSTKPFIIIALMPGSMIWLLFNRIKNIKNVVLRTLLTPLLIALFLVIGSQLMSSLSESMGDYGSLNSVLEKAAITQQDLLRVEAYGTHSYNIGTFEPTLSGVAPKIPASLMAGLFRPYLWDSGNLVMLISGIENTFLLFLVFYCFLRVGVFKFFGIIFSDPLLTFSFLFSIFFAFTVGLASANFGALVRYKIPLLPFFVATLFVTLKKVQEVYRLKKAEKEKE